MSNAKRFVGSNVKRFVGLNMLVALILGTLLGLSLIGSVALKAYGAEGAGAGAATPVHVRQIPDSAVGAALMSAALAVSISCVAAGIAVGMTGSAAIGAIAEKPELMGRTILFVGLAEGLAIYGLIIAIMILGKI